MLRVLPLMWPGFCIMEIADASEFLYWCLRLVRLSSRDLLEQNCQVEAETQTDQV
jgi:hypothetical protein